MVEEVRKVGGEVDSFCTKCKMVLAHTILAMVGSRIARVRCNTCMGEHAYKAAAPAAKAPKAPAAKKSKAKAKPGHIGQVKVEAGSWQTMMAGKDPANARPFNIKQKFSDGELVQHPTFGVGVVAASRGVGKIDVVFESGVKTLMHNKDAMVTEMARALPRRVATEETDESAQQAPGATGGEA